MRAIQLEKIDSRSELEKLGSALTFEGLNLDEDNLNSVYDWLEKYTTVEVHVMYYVTGKDMNEWYGLYGDNAYPDDLNIVMLDLNDMHDPKAIILPRFDVGGRWLDDVIENNVRRYSDNDY